MNADIRFRWRSFAKAHDISALEAQQDLADLREQISVATYRKDEKAVRCLTSWESSASHLAEALAG